MGEVNPPDPSAPEGLKAEHKLDSFDSGVTVLDDWLKRHARKNEESGASRTYVLCIEQKVVGYYSLAAGSILRARVPSRVRRNMPDPSATPTGGRSPEVWRSIPVMLLGRLAVDRSCQGKGFGKGLLRDAVLRTIHAAGTAGIRAILVHAISEDAKHFYKACGFQQSPVDPMTLLVPIEDAKSFLGL